MKWQVNEALKEVKGETIDIFGANRLYPAFAPCISKWGNQLPGHLFFFWYLQNGCLLRLLSMEGWPRSHFQGQGLLFLTTFLLRQISMTMPMTTCTHTQAHTLTSTFLPLPGWFPRLLFSPVLLLPQSYSFQVLPYSPKRCPDCAQCCHCESLYTAWITPFQHPLLTGLTEDVCVLQGV